MEKYLSKKENCIKEDSSGNTDPRYGRRQHIRLVTLTRENNNEHLGHSRKYTFLFSFWKSRVCLLLYQQYIIVCTLLISKIKLKLNL